MYLIKGITDDYKQKQTLVLADGSQLILIIEFKPMQMGWFINHLEHNDFKLDGIRIVTSPNILHQFKNQISFGLACFVEQNQEPILQQDFLSERAKLYILSAEEVAQYGEFLSGQTTA